MMERQVVWAASNHVSCKDDNDWHLSDKSTVRHTWTCTVWTMGGCSGILTWTSTSIMITKRLQHTQFKCVRNGKGSDMCNAQYSVSVFKNAATDTGCYKQTEQHSGSQESAWKFKCNQDEAQTSVCTSHFSR